jgi:hypothetical protein
MPPISKENCDVSGTSAIFRFTFLSKSVRIAATTLGNYIQHENHHFLSLVDLSNYLRRCADSSQRLQSKAIGKLAREDCSGAKNHLGGKEQFQRGHFTVGRRGKLLSLLEH